LCVCICVKPKINYWPWNHKYKDYEHTTPKKRHLQIKRLLNIYFGNKERICVIEVGSGYGALAKILTEDSQYVYYGFEPSNNRAQLCKNHGLNVKADFFSADAVGCSVDAVIIDNVLEHAPEPRSILFEASKVLKPGGLLIVIVPNLYDIRQIWKYWRKRYFWRPICHINYFIVHHLKKAFKDFGFEFHPFGLSPLRIRADLLFFPRALLDTLGVHIFGLNWYGIKLEGENQCSLESANKRRTNTAEFR